MAKKKQLKANLTSGDVLQHLISLTLPMSFGVFTIIGFNLADTFFVGQLGSTELAAMAFTFPIPMIVGSISFGIGSATSSFTARAIGSGNVEKVKDYTTYSLLLAILIVSMVAIFGFLTIEQQFRLMGADDTVMPYIKEYMSIWYLSTPFIVIPMAGNSVIRSLGDTKSPAVVMTVAGLVNIILDPILIFGLGPIPAMSLKGAAIATTISRILTLVASLHMLHFKYGVLKNPFSSLSKVLHVWKNIISLAIPATLTNVINPLSIAVVTKMVSSYGNKVVAGFGVGTRIESFMAIVLIGLSASLGPFVGQNFGAKKFKRINLALNYANSFPVIWAILCFIVMFFFSDPISRIFNSDPEVISASRDYLLIMTIGLIGNGILQNVVNVFNVLGRPKVSLVANIFKMFVIYLPYALILRGFYNEYGIYIAGLCAHIFTGFFALMYMRKTCFLDNQDT
ncbi:MATE family efflux transporter [Bacteriovorax sp. DB6_IX]|uniref:MATE family efflux transporter n=1 Tax=Bacteriovorax sp. DB6_IX TaxID=1353530 RepID=UPI000389EB25|nr:MATE family efflux transporter [Bacteriovorax sp. DB6_IX]EQC52224.1 MATE efflux family protein [Bacteriovorax sp. DB6_IX]